MSCASASCVEYLHRGSRSHDDVLHTRAWQRQFVRPSVDGAVHLENDWVGGAHYLQCFPVLVWCECVASRRSGLCLDGVRDVGSVSFREAVKDHTGWVSPLEVVFAQ